MGILLQPQSSIDERGIQQARLSQRYNAFPCLEPVQLPGGEESGVSCPNWSSRHGRRHDKATRCRRSDV